MKNIISVVQIIISLLLMTAILLQAKGEGLGTAFGGSGEFYQSKRGLEKILFALTIFLAFLFLLSSILSVIL